LEDRILIVDAEKMVYSIIARRLAKEGYAFVMANNGREALDDGMYAYFKRGQAMRGQIKITILLGIDQFAL